jgi:hypothetical protein
MRGCLIQYAVRLTCGLGLLLVAAVQEKVCTWPVPSESKARQENAPAAPPASKQRPAKKRAPLTLAAMLPDVVAPRWPGHMQLTAVRRVWPRSATTRLDGPEGAGRQADANAGAAVTGGWTRRAPRKLAPTGSCVDIRVNPTSRHAFQTSILRTGPPGA